ncbi:malate synthase A [Flexithrix dorotheae]|uniref:malate synthase A n=1 Tax=Flexithrix dorotheae TaxID=70993 RepID=UPI00036DAF45|nr:malate synthase A [Flexithrix dorotheae]
MHTTETTLKPEIELTKQLNSNYEKILTPDALQFLAALHKKFNSRRKALLAKRIERQQEIDAGKFPKFLNETAKIRLGNWKVAPLPKDLLDRRVEITGPVERKMIINALNSGANVFMADFEDSTSPTWENIMDGQINLMDAVRRTITFQNSGNGKQYKLNKQTATLMVRPRGWHLEDKNLLIGGEPISGALMDFGLYFFHNAIHLIAKGSGPYFYLPKLESHLEARLWNDVFNFAQTHLGILKGTIKATVLIETILAAFEMDEILFELKEHSCGLNCGRWDYIFSFIKKFRNHPGFILPNRDQVGMTVPFMKAYTELVIKTCHRRNVHAMGGMAAQIPIKNDEQANFLALQKVATDKEREARAGHDGTWVAHPGLVKIAKEQFDRYMPNPNQIEKKRYDVKVEEGDLMAVPEGTITSKGIKTNIDIAIRYIHAWISGNGCVPIYHLMEDAATAEISRAQLWQWIHNKAVMDDGKPVTLALYYRLLHEVMDNIKREVGDLHHSKNRNYQKAVIILNKLVENKEFEEFLTIPGYQYLS